MAKKTEHEDEKEPTTVYLQSFVLRKIRGLSKSQYMSTTAWIERAVNRQLMAELESPENLRVICEPGGGKSKI